MDATRPAPYPADTKAKGWRFELDMERVRQSDTWALAGAQVRPWLFMLWAVAWEQTPCGSLPSDDELIAARLEMPIEDFKAVRSKLMRGWWTAEDGRLYNDTITERVLMMLETRGSDRTRQEARRTLFEKIRERDGQACVYCGHTKYLTLDHLHPVSRGGGNDELNLAIACRPCNSKKRDRTPEEAGMSFVNAESADRWRRYKESAGEKRSNADECEGAQRNDTSTGTGTLLSPSLRSGEKPAKRGTRLPKDWILPEDWMNWALKERPDLDPSVTACRFADHWHAEAGAKASKVDWEATWRNWVRNERAPRPPPGARPITAAERNILQAVPTLAAPHLRTAPSEQQLEVFDVTPRALG